MAIRFFDMFAGIGGFRSGLEAVGGFECIGHCEIDKKNHIKVDVEVYLSADCEAGKISTKIQKEIYDDIYDATEISAVKVNVIILGFISKK